MADGDGWMRCAHGHRHWGVHGAAGLLVAVPGEPWVLLQHRAPWSHRGDTWGVPGGARHRDETALEAAGRETVEETGLDIGRLSFGEHHVVDHKTWSYTTIVAVAPSRLPVVPEQESVEVRWVAAHDVEGLPLHPAFAQAWPALRLLIP